MIALVFHQCERFFFAPVIDLLSFSSGVGVCKVPVCGELRAGRSVPQARAALVIDGLQVEFSADGTIAFWSIATGNVTIWSGRRVRPGSCAVRSPRLSQIVRLAYF